ncbi:hypothetical protein KAH94_00495 [bacterium]|nr:hypothetical protein [bacterium]
MKKRIGLLLSVACIVSATQVIGECCECDTIGHTYFAGRPQYQSASAEKITLFRDRMDAKKDIDAKGGAFQFTVFGGKSGNESGLRSFFSPTCKTKLNVKEEGFIDSNRADLEKELPESTDIIGRHFRILTNNGYKRLGSEPVYEPLFESEICFTPKQTTFGIGLTWRQNLTTLWADSPEDKDYNWWVEVSSPLTYIKNTMGLTEKVLEDGGEVYEDIIEELGEDYEFFGNMKDAFNQKAFKYGKIIDSCNDKCNAMSKWRLADIELKVGAEWVKGDTCVLEGYFGILLPTGNKPTAEYMFEPIVGHAGHWGILKGSSAYFKVWEDEVEGKKLHVTTDLNGTYLFERCEKRSFDLKCRPWSRYMEVYVDADDAKKADEEISDSVVASKLYATPGINVFTQDLKVRPRLSCSLNTAFVYTKEESGFRGELGYNCYARQKECVKLSCPWKTGVVLKASGGDGDSAPLATIGDRKELIETEVDTYTEVIHVQSNSFNEDFHNKVSITESDLDLDSAAHPAVFSHTFHASMGKRWEENEDRDYPTYLGAGASYEFGSDNAAMSRWTLWAKAGVSF